MRKNAMTQAERAIIDVMTQPADDRTDVRRGIIGYRTRRIWHGPMMDVLIYPIYSRAGMAEVREALREHGPTREAQARCNHRRSQERLIRLANENFSDGDMLLTMTFAAPEEGGSEESARKIIRAYMARMRRYWRQHRRELKYLATLEMTESAKNGRRYHLHLIVNGNGFDRDEVEGLWRHGLCNARRHQYQDKGMGGFAAYLSVYKDRQSKAGRKAWWGSRNLREPRESVADHAMSRRMMDRIVQGMEMDGAYWAERAYPDYRLVDDVEIRRSDIVPGAYMTVRMRRREVARRE